jgi:DNA anti-recombination protein RmuC
MRDKVIKDVIEKFKERSDVGYKKYGVTLHDDEPNLHKWLNHLQEELMDAVNYIQKLRMETTDALEEKILNDYKEEDSFSKYTDPGYQWSQDKTW